MGLSEKDLAAIGLLFEEKLESAFELRLDPFQREVNERFDHVYKKLETHDQEFTVIRGQLDRMDTRLERLECKVDGHAERIQALEKKAA